MDMPWLTASELAAALKLSVVSFRRAYWKGHLPVIRIGRMVRFDLDQVRQAIERNGHRYIPGRQFMHIQRLVVGCRTTMCRDCVRDVITPA
jgi:excisionase family DNA binding protein